MVSRPPLLASTIRDRATLGHPRGGPQRQAAGPSEATATRACGRMALHKGGRVADRGLRARAEFWPVTLLSAALVAVLGGWGTAVYLDRTRSVPACERRTTLRIEAAPSIAPAARQVADRRA